MSVLSPEKFIAHLQGHRRLTRRLMDAFPADQFETFSVGGLRPMGVMVRELLAMGAPIFRGFATDEWQWDDNRTPMAKDAALAAWDASTTEIDALWPTVVQRGLDREITLFGQWPGTVAGHLQYMLDNEVHHRGQGYVYLRALGIEPPAFWERG